MSRAGWMIAAAHKSSGKTTVSVGLTRALCNRGLAVQPFKKGPDYIDPIWLSLASGRSCRNLDPYLMGWDEITRVFGRYSGAADVALLEANIGLFDGLDIEGRNSNAELAKRLNLPVILVIDARGMTRGIAPLLLGYQAFDPEVRLAGVILNRIGGRRHEAKLRAVIEHYTDLPVLGAVQEEEGLFVTERHLGLVPGYELDEHQGTLDRLAQRMADQIDLAFLLKLQQGTVAADRDSNPGAAPEQSAGEPASRTHDRAGRVTLPRVRIGVIRDRAFGFYYAEDLEGLEGAGADLIFLDALRDSELPALDGLYIGGGFPEMVAPQLTANQPFRDSLRRALEAGLPAYAECGGLMYLARQLITVDGQSWEMVGFIPGTVVMHPKPVGRGYVHLAESDDHPWPRRDSPMGVIRAHEFHYSSLEGLPATTRYAYRVERGYGIDGDRDGLIQGRLLASYTHLRTIGSCHWTDRFVEYVRRSRTQN